MDKSESNNEQQFDAEIDASDLFCPQPVLLAKKALDRMSKNSVLKLIATDPSSKKDIEAFVDQAGYKLIDSELNDELFIFYIEKVII